jgi:hypothetical protein
MPRSRLLSPSRLIRRAALYKGLFGGSKGWLAVGAVIWGRGFAKKAFGRNEEVVATEVLKAGQFVRLESLAPPTRKQRKAARRAS